MNKYKQALINLKAELEPVNTRYVKSGKYLKDLGLLGELVEKENIQTVTLKIKVDTSELDRAINKTRELKNLLTMLRSEYEKP